MTTGRRPYWVAGGAGRRLGGVPGGARVWLAEAIGHLTTSFLGLAKAIGHLSEAIERLSEAIESLSEAIEELAKAIE